MTFLLTEIFFPFIRLLKQIKLLHKRRTVTLCSVFLLLITYFGHEHCSSSTAPFCAHSESGGETDIAFYIFCFRFLWGLRRVPSWKMMFPSFNHLAREGDCLTSKINCSVRGIESEQTNTIFAIFNLCPRSEMLGQLCHLGKIIFCLFFF